MSLFRDENFETLLEGYSAQKPQIGGWITFFVVTSYLGCISLVMQVLRSTSVSRTLLLCLMFTSTLLPAILVPLRSRLSFAAIWVQFALRMVVTAITSYTIWTLHTDPRYTTLEHDVTSQVGAVSVSIAWILYFHYSRRVRQTFGHNL